MNKFVIYTVLVGDYDDIMQPTVVDGRFEYLLFTNNFHDGQNVGVWKVRALPNDLCLDNKRLSRYPKTHPSILLSEYVASLYIDANIQIVDSWVYSRFIELYEANVEHAGVRLVLTGRDCIYEHTFDMCQSLLEHDYVAIHQCSELYKRGFPAHFGLNENNIIFRRHTEQIKKVDEEWWQWIINFSSRDQFSYMYCLWKYHIPLNYFLPIGEDARNGNHFRLVKHDSRAFVLKTKVVRRSIFERLRIKSRRFDVEQSLINWSIIYKSKYPILHLYCLSLKEIITNLHNLLKAAIQ